MTGGGRTNTWDSQNRLASCAVGDTLTTYTYGADGLRRRMEAQTQYSGGPIHPGHPSHSSYTVTDEGTSYAYDGTMLVREGHAQTTDGVSSLQPETVTATYLIGARGPEYRRDDTQTETDSQGRAVTKARWYVYDGLGSVVGEVDPAGNLTSSPKYDVYGAVRSNAGSATSKQGFVGSLGHVSDDTGLVYMRARYYDPSVGRFVSEDPGFNGGNWFAYADNNPVNRVDADGKSSELADAAIVLGIGMMALGVLFPSPSIAAIEMSEARLALSSASASVANLLSMVGDAALLILSGQPIGATIAAYGQLITDIARTFISAAPLAAMGPAAARLGMIVVGEALVIYGIMAEE